MEEKDNREGDGVIYFIHDIAPHFGRIDIGQVSTSTMEFVIYTDESEWISDMEALGIDYSEE